MIDIEEFDLEEAALQKRLQEWSGVNRIFQRNMFGCHGDKNSPVEFSTTEELLSIPWIAKWKDMPTFHRFSKSQECLMLELKGGREWWVLGHLHNQKLVDLPEWKEPDGK